MFEAEKTLIFSKFFFLKIYCVENENYYSGLSITLIATNTPTTIKQSSHKLKSYCLIVFSSRDPQANSVSVLFVIICPIKNKLLFHLGQPLDTTEYFSAISAVCQTLFFFTTLHPDHSPNK